MVMGFILPFALAFIAIPLESFIHSARTVLGLILVGILRGIAFILRFIGNVSKSTGEVLVKLYDLFAFPPIWIEGLVKDAKNAKK
jgi:hypothetical protein